MMYIFYSKKNNDDGSSKGLTLEELAYMIYRSYNIAVKANDCMQGKVV